MTIKDIARLAGVSISTVSKIINNKDENINAATRSRVLKIVKEYNYTPYGMVKDLSTSKKFLLGVLLRTSTHSFRIISGILQAAQEHGYTILLLDSQNDCSTEAKHITSLCKNHVDGVLWEPVSKTSLENVHQLEIQNIPFYFFNGLAGMSSFQIDFVQLGYFMTQTLIDYRHTNIACLLKENSKRPSMLLKGFKKCLYDNQIPYSDKMLLTIEDSDYCQKIISQNVTGIISSHFASSLMLYEQLSRLHYYIPSDLSLVSLKDDMREAISFPHISSIHIPYYDFGYSICCRLIQLCEKVQTEEPAFLFSSNPKFDHFESVCKPSFLRNKQIIVVGSINMDVTFNVSSLPQQGKAVTIEKTTTMVGGKGANQAVGAARMGHLVSLIGKVGNDADSSIILDLLEKENVTAQGIHRNKKEPTGKAYIYTESSGESAVTILPGANGCLTPSDIYDSQYLFNNAIYCLISTEIPINTVLAAAQTAKANHVKTILKPAALKEIPDELLANTDLFVPNRKEALTLSGNLNSIEKQAEYFISKGVSTVIITLGHEGCYLKNADHSAYFTASDSTPVDTTGGADAFIAALASYLTDGYELEKAITIAGYAAGVCISRQGVISGLVDKSALEAQIAKKEPALLH